jgi:hypothetical protein
MVYFKVLFRYSLGGLRKTFKTLRENSCCTAPGQKGQVQTSSQMSYCLNQYSQEESVKVWKNYCSEWQQVTLYQVITMTVINYILNDKAGGTWVVALTEFTSKEWDES